MLKQLCDWREPTLNLFGDNHRLTLSLGDGQIILNQRLYVRLDGFLDVDQGFFPAFALRYSSRQTGTLRNPKPVFPGIDDHFAHNDASCSSLPLAGLPMPAQDTHISILSVNYSIGVSECDLRRIIHSEKAICVE